MSRVWWALWAAVSACGDEGGGHRPGDAGPTSATTAATTTPTSTTRATSTTTSTATTTPTASTTLTLDGVLAVPSELVPTVVHVTWTSSQSGTSFVEYGLTEPLQDATPHTTMAGTEHHVVVLGLKEGRAYRYRPVTLTDAGERIEGPVQTLTIEAAEADRPRFSLVQHDVSRAAPGGFVLLTATGAGGSSFVGALDRDGDWVWTYRDPKARPVLRARLAADRESLLLLYAYVPQIDDVGAIVRIGLDGTWLSETRALDAHHDFLELPDGELAWLAFVYDDVDVDGDLLPIAADAVRTAPEGLGDSPVEVFNYFQDYGHDVWQVCDHMEADRYVRDAHEWTHSNSLAYDEASDAFLVMSRHLDSLLKVDRSTGTVLWQLGGLFGDVTALGGPILWSHGHTSHQWPGGMLVFDNDVHGGKESRVVEYAIDEVAGTVRQVWEFYEPGGGFSDRLGDARRLEGGNTLISWTQMGSLTEVTPSGDIVWQVDMEGDSMVGRVQRVADLYAP